MRPGDEVDAHIIPEAFFRDISEEGAVLKQREIGGHAKKLRIGVYDRNLWCNSCEREFGRWDDYAITILRTPLEKFDVLSAGYELEIERPENLKLFFIALLWRASASTHRLFEQVSIGPYEEVAKHLLNSNSAGSPEQFSIIISCSGTDERLIAEPVPIRRNGVKFYRFYLGRFMADIKVDKRLTPKNLSIAAVGHSKNLCILRVQQDVGLVKSASNVAKQLTRHPGGTA